MTHPWNIDDAGDPAQIPHGILAYKFLVWIISRNESD
jgi:hypothetical protein